MDPVPIAENIRLGEVRFTEPPPGGFTYRIPDAFGGALPGIRVRVPFGRQNRTGFLVRVYFDTDQDNFRDILQLVDEIPLLSDELLRLTRWIADYYLCDWGEVIAAAIPGGLTPRNRALYHLSEAGLAEVWMDTESTPGSALWHALKSGSLSLKQIRESIDDGENLLQNFRKRGWVDVLEQEPSKRLTSTEILWQWNDLVNVDEARSTLPGNAKKMLHALEILQENGGRITSSQLRKVSSEKGLPSAMRSLQGRGWILRHEVPRDLQSHLQQGLAETATEPAILTETQQQIVRSIVQSMANSESRPFLLHGVTGSGKTLIYLEAVEAALAVGKGVIMMAPEISLTPQLMGRFYRKFGDLVSLTHSRMTSVERRNVWQRIRSGKARIAIGPRSVVFAPVNQLGLLIVDEEHEESYKQVDPNPRYNGRDVAIYRAKLNNCAVVIGSATPDTISYHNALSGRFHLLEMKERYGGALMPPVWVVQWGIGKEETLFSRKLLSAIEKRLELKQQTILLINRRGFSTNIRCPDCGAVAECPNCDISLRYHRDGLKLECHYCGYVEKAYDLCPNCKSFRLRYSGIGSQRVERELLRIFPEAKVARMDLDTTRAKGSHQNILEGFGRREFDILLGTKMVAKGHDFPGVTLVGILAADMEWLRPDFRAAERAFRLLVQAAGRAGRDSAGEVIIQSWTPSENLLRFVQQHDYRAMYESEIPARQALKYPPFSRLISVWIKSANQEQVMNAAAILRETFDAMLKQSIILGPAPPLIERIDNMFRRRLLIKIPPRAGSNTRQEKERIRLAVDNVRKKFKKHNIYIFIDVDPVDV